ncbi:hypothetical protein CN902_27445 [Priestia megaterium]|uniref:hypothetical protein n=1 Tax=Priestia megaterium TaxID=1404 RepID=UPI000BFCB8E4|nr:hypothetical protein [Priestia megaterium]PGK21415.1 hypothetical protein CN902_27445 [Priestia megaterium]
MLKIIYRSDGQLRLVENEKEEILAKRASKYYYSSQKGDYVIYLSQSQYWHKGDLFIKHEGKKPKQFGSNVNLIYVSSTADFVLFIDNFYNINNMGSLYLIRDGEKKTCLDRNVSGTVILVEKDDNKYKIFYQKYSKDHLHTLCVIDENGTKNVLGKKFDNIQFFCTNQDQIRTVAEVHTYKRTEKEVKTFTFHDEELVDTQHSSYRYNDPLDKVIFNEQTLTLQKQYFQQFGFQKESDNIVFQFSNHHSSRYFVACEIAKRAKHHFILESPYQHDDSINHIALFSKNQVEDIILLQYTLTTGLYFLAQHKLFGVNVEDLFKHAGSIYGHLGTDYSKIVNSGFMIKDTSEKIMFLHIYETLMKVHGFTYKRELQAYLQQTYLLPQHERYEKGMNFYKKFISSKEEEKKLEDRMKQIEEDLILQGKIPSKWKSEAEMFRLIKEVYPTARMHASPDWLSPQHLDVYIEDMNIAFEYQGEQHFLSIDFFGGDEGLKKRLKLDQRKKALCLKYGVELVEWMFYEPVTKIILEQKMKSILKQKVIK